MRNYHGTNVDYNGASASDDSRVVDSESES